MVDGVLASYQQALLFVRSAARQSRHPALVEN
jgi:hypothetical protein